MPHNFWNSLENCKDYLKWLGERLKFKDMDDWYKITCYDFIENYGSHLLKNHNASPPRVLMHVFNNYKWILWKFSKIPEGTMSDMANRRMYMDWLGGELKYKKMDDWYKITHKAFTGAGSNLLKKYYKDCPCLAVMDVYSEHKWYEWNFINVPKGFWDNLDNKKKYLEWLAAKLGYRNMKDWYTVGYYEFYNNKGRWLVDKNCNIPSLIMDVFKDYKIKNKK